MAKTLDDTESLAGSSSLSPALRAVWTLRLALGWIIIAGSIISLLGTSWDIQWHSFIGRDRILIPPHLMILSGITFSGIAALMAVFIETFWTRRNSLLAQHSTSFAGLFSAPLGAYLAGFAALAAAVAFPLDAYWHALYGIDVRIWAPFHVMILSGGALMPLGAAYMLVSAAHLASSAGAQGATRAGYFGAIVAIAVTLSLFTILLSDATDDPGFLTLGSVTINLFPLLSGALVAWLLVSVMYAIPWRWAATSVTLVYFFFGLLFEVFVPPATSYLVALEHLAYRRDLGDFVNLSIITMRFWPLLPIVAAILIDNLHRRARRRGWSARKLTIALTLAAFIACLPVMILEPTLPVLLVIYLGIGFLISMLLGLLGTFTGTWLGQRMGDAMQRVEGRA